MYLICTKAKGIKWVLSWLVWKQKQNEKLIVGTWKRHWQVIHLCSPLCPWHFRLDRKSLFSYEKNVSPWVCLTIFPFGTWTCHTVDRIQKGKLKLLVKFLCFFFTGESCIQPQRNLHQLETPKKCAFKEYVVCTEICFLPKEWDCARNLL